MSKTLWVYIVFFIAATRLINVIFYKTETPQLLSECLASLAELRFKNIVIQH